ncbi:MAG: hypothetical protein WCX60_02540 [Anaerovoracaceae bacterium]
MNEDIQSYSYEQANLINAFRTIMSKMTYLIRFYVVESITGLGNPEATYNEILMLPLEKSQLVITIPGFTGDFPQVALAYLAEMRILIDGMVSGDQAKADESIRRLYELSDETAKILAELSPYWEEEKWRDLLYRYNRCLVAEIIAVKEGDFNQALNIFETLMGIALTAGDYYAEGFIHFFPEDQPQIPIAYFNMIKDLRSIGTERAYLTRFYMVARVVELFDDMDVTRRFFVLMPRLKEKFELIMGTEDAVELLTLLSMYVIRLEGLIDAILSGDQAQIDTQVREVDEYTGRIASFLSSINPYWDETKWKEHFDRSAKLIIEQSYNFQRKEYVEAMKNFEKFLYASLEIDDYFAYGLYQYTKLPSSMSPLSNRSERYKINFSFGL